MYKCDKCNNLTNIKIYSNTSVINVQNKCYIKDGKYYTQILCEICSNNLKNIKWSEHIGSDLIKESSIKLNDKLCIKCNYTIIEDICYKCKIKCLNNCKKKNIYDTEFNCKYCGITINSICYICKYKKY